MADLELDFVADRTETWGLLKQTDHVHVSFRMTDV